MITIRRSDQRGDANHGWLKSKHTFSFANYYDPKHVNFGPLRVINEDQVKGGTGFGTHGHRDMEIISYVLDGALEHKDSIGTGSVIRPGEIQRMTAGSGIHHSEYNHSKTDPVHFLQIWIEPSEGGLDPSYEQTAFSEAERRGTLRLVGSRNGRDGSVTIHQNTDLYLGLFDGTEKATFHLEGDRIAWVQIARGSLAVNGERLNTGDGAAIEDVTEITFENGDNAEVLLFDMAPKTKQGT
ncbi:MAG: pirin family protein [Pseudomonadota bacterium]